MFKFQIEANSPQALVALLLQSAAAVSAGGALPSATPAGALAGGAPQPTTAAPPPPAAAPPPVAAVSPNGVPAANLQPLFATFVQKFNAMEGKKILQHYGIERIGDAAGAVIDQLHDYLSNSVR